MPAVPGDDVGDYRIESLIAQGGFGTVYRAVHRRTGGRAAIKVLHPELIHSVALARFEREAHVLHQIRHPAMVEVYELGLLGGDVPYLVMELVGGDDLSIVITRRKRLPPDEVAAIVRPVAEALAAAHARGIVHRDVKASNVRLDPDRAASPVVLLDFGVAKLLDAEGPGLTSTRQTVGSACCNAPEQIEGGDIDARTDVYGLAVLAYHMLTGRQPFASESPTVTQFRHLLSPRPRASTRAGIAPAIDAVIARGMAIDPGERFSGPVELAAAFDEAVAEDARLRALPPERRTVVAITINVEPVLELDETLLRHIESIRERCRQKLAGAGYQLAREFDRGQVLVVALPADASEARRLRDRVVTDTIELAREITACAGPDVRFHACLGLGPADRIGGELWDGAAVEPLRMPGAAAGSVIGAAAVFEGLAVATDEIAPGHRAVRR